MLGLLSLRTRFLLSPILGVLLTLILYLTSNQVIQSHAELFQKLSETNLVQISEIGKVAILLTDYNNEIITLLLKSGSLDEEDIYIEGKKQLNQLYRIEKQLNTSISEKDSLKIAGKDIFIQIRWAFSTYRHQAISTIEMLSVDTTQASNELVLANEKLKALNNLFLQLSDHYTNELAQQASQVEGTLYKKTYITELAIVLMALMLWSAFYFSKATSVGLTQVYDALMRLSKGDTKVEVQQYKDAYIKNIWAAVSEFKESIEKSNVYKNDLLIQQFAMDQHSIIAITDIKGTITYANTKFCEISGYTTEELIGSNHRIVNSENQSKDYWRDMYLTVSKGNVWHDEVLNKTKDGHLYWVDTSIIPMTSVKEKSKITGYIAIRTDITEKKNQYQKLVDANVLAEAAVVAKSQFLATMSHEIRTPMNGVLGMLDIILNNELETKQKHRAEVAQNSAKSLLFLINDILDFSKIDAGKLELESTDFDIRIMLDEFAESMSYQAKEKGLVLILDTTHISESVVVGDSGRIRQILTNIVGNAIKFTQQGEVNIRTELKALNDKNWQFNCSISDTGLGIPEDKISHLFESFSQVDASTTRKYGGSGLGLAISKKLVELMHGNISVCSDEGKGSCFSFTIQLGKNSTLAQALPDISTPEKLALLQWPKNTRLLLVDDDLVNQMVAQGTLEYFGLQAEIAVNGVEALSKLKQANNNTPFSLVLMDCQMPEMDGYEASRQIRDNQAGEHNRNIPIIAMTANSMVGDREKCLHAGMNDYVVKPIDPDTLLDKLKHWLLK